MGGIELQQSESRGELGRGVLYRIAAFQYHETIANIMERDVFMCSPLDSVKAVARIMAERRISSVVVTDANLRPAGIVTERDIVKKFVAIPIACSSDITIGEIMTPAPVCLPSSATLFDALSIITRHDIKHLPVVSDGKVEGILTVRQILKIRYAEPFVLIARLEEATSVEDYRFIKDELVYLVKEKMAENTDPLDLVTMLSLVNAGIHRRVLRDIIREMGPSPVEFCFFVTGSHGRKENLLFPDQDYCVIIEDCDEQLSQKSDEYFLAVSQRLSDRLDQIGFPYCTGKIMGTNPQWRGSVSEWQTKVTKIIRQQTAYTVRYMTLLFDSAYLFGNIALFNSYQGHAFNELALNHTVLRQMHDEEEGGHKVPLGWFSSFITEKGRKHRGEIDMKKSGLIFIIESARILALKYGVRETSTIRRIQALVEKGAIQKDDSEYFENAYRVILYHTLNAQVENFIAREGRDYYLNPRSLSRRNREMLKDAFKAVTTLQEIVRSEYGEMA
ncbi:MAG: CBS domain-containing protein [Nitrospira sp.]|nr:CBS domain-containing protein [Nitrospira sp.]